MNGSSKRSKWIELLKAHGVRDNDEEEGKEKGRRMSREML